MSTSTDAEVAADASQRRRPPAPRRGGLGDWLSQFDRKVTPYIYVSPFFLLFGLIGLFPLAYTFYVSMYDWDLLKGKGDFVGLANFGNMLTNEMFWNSITNTIYIFLLSSVPQILVALVLAAVLDQNLRGKSFWRMGILLPYVVAPVAVALIFSSVFNEADGLANNLLNMIGIGDQEWKHTDWQSWTAIASMVNWRWTGYNALILLAAMQAVPRDMYESAAIDGAGWMRRFTSITIPSIRPTVIFVIITSTIGGLQIFAEPRLFDVSSAGGIGGADRQFQTTVLFLWEMAFFRRDFGNAAAVAWLLFLLIVIFGLINFFISRRIATSGPSDRASRRKTKKVLASKEAAK